MLSLLVRFTHSFTTARLSTFLGSACAGCQCWVPVRAPSRPGCLHVIHATVEAGSIWDETPFSHVGALWIGGNHLTSLQSKAFVLSFSPIVHSESGCVWPQPCGA